VLAAVLGAAGDREPQGEAAQDPLVEAIVGAQEAREQAMTRLRVSGRASAAHYHGRAFVPPLQVVTSYAVAEGRVSQSVQGPDLDASIPPDGSTTVPVRHLERLFLPDGMVETFDRDARVLSYTELKYGDARAVYSLTAPSEVTWSFASSMRSPILRQRALRLALVEGAAPARVVHLLATAAGGTQEFRYECDEAWGWLPRRVGSWNGTPGRLELTYCVEVAEVHTTRLGTFPACARITDLRTGDPAAPYHQIDLAFDAPSFEGVAVPATLNGADARAEAAADPLYGPQSFLAQNRLWDRGVAIEELFGRGGIAGAVPLAGEADAWSAWLPWVLVSGAALALALLARRGKGAALVLAGATALAAVASPAVGWLAGPPPRVEAKVVAAADASLRSRSLCGIDALYGLIRLAEADRISYLRLLRLVRPGHMGTDLATLERVAETLDLPVAVVDAGSFALPPSPSIVHLDGDHFVLIAQAARGRVQVFDPGIGIVDHAWADLQQRVSRPMLALSRARRSS
jgi:hypothetical protein